MQSFVIFIIYMLWLITISQYLYHQLLNPKTDHILLIDIILNILFVVLYLLLQSHPFISTTLLYVFVFLPSLFYKEDIKHKLTITFMSLTFAVASETAWSTFFIALSPLFPHTNMIPTLFKTNNQYILISIFSFLSGSFFCLLAYQAASIFKNYFTVLKSGYILKLCFYYMVVIFFQNMITSSASVKESLFILPVFVISTIIMCILFDRVLKQISTQSQEIALKKQKVELLETQLTSYKDTEAQYMSIRHWNHDIANHLMALSHLIESSQYEEAKEYIKHIIEEE